MTTTIQCASLEAFLLYNYQDKLRTIALSCDPREAIHEIHSNYDLDLFYKEHKFQIDSVAEQVFYDRYVGCPESWFSLSKLWGFNILKIKEAQRFYTLIALKEKAKELMNR
jgi:hypothetical protein